MINVAGGRFLQPNRLPDAALSRIPDAAAVDALLAVSFIAGIAQVAHTDDQLVLSVIHKFGDIQREGMIAAVMPASHLVVHPHLAQLINCAEVQQHPAAVFGLLQRERPLIPQRIGDLYSALYAGEQRFRRIRYADFPVPVIGESLVRPDGILPHTVQAHPVVAHELRAGILAQWTVCQRLIAPWRFKGTDGGGFLH